MHEIIQCLIDWLEENPSEVKAHRILRALAYESLKKADYEKDKRLFDGLDVVAAANENKENYTSANNWIDWKRTVLKYWKTRENQIIDYAKKRNLKSYPKPDRISSEGGPENTNYLITAEPLPKINSHDEHNSEPEQDKNHLVINYEKAENGEVKPAYWVKWLFNNGQIRLSSWHIYVIIGWLLIIGISTVVLSYLIWIGLTMPKQITTKELTSFISLFMLPYFVWLAFIKPWVRLFDDRIVLASENIIAFKEKSAQMELFRDGDLRLIRLVRYSAPCPICGATIYLDKSEPDFPRRLVGRCNESPREHVYSFDRVTQQGSVLRRP